MAGGQRGNVRYRRADRGLPRRAAVARGTWRGRLDVFIPGHGSVGGADQVRARIEQDRSYVQSLRDASVPEDPRLGPAATYNWLLRVHERQLQQLAQRSERNGTPG